MRGLYGIIFMYAMNNCSPIGAIAAMYETYGTLTDRDYVISVTGKQKDKTFSVVPMDKEKFRNDKAKPYSNKAFLEILDKAYPNEYADEDDEPKMKKKSAVKSKKVEEDEEDTDLPFTTPVDDEYSDMSPKELYKLCKERKIEAEMKKPAAYYAELLREADKAEDDWGDEEEDEDDDDDWE